MKGQRSSFAVFSISFLISLAILASVMAVILSATAETRQPQSSASSDLSTRNYYPDADDGFRILLIAADSQNRTEGFILASLDPAAVRLTLVSLPGELAVTLDGREGTLLSHDRYAGSEEALRAAEVLLDTEVDRWLRVTRKGAIHLIDALGGMEWEFSQPLETERLSIPVGRHLLDGETVVTLMEENGSGIPDRTGILSALMGQRLTEQLLNRGDWLFQVLVSNTEGNVSQFDYQSHKKLLRWYLTHEERQLTGFSARVQRDADGSPALAEGERERILGLPGGGM